jgi:hypothetical protein
MMGENRGVEEMAYPPPMMPNEFAGDTTQSHSNRSAGRLDNVPTEHREVGLDFDGRVVIARVQASLSVSSRIGVASESVARREGEMRMKCGCGNSKWGPAIICHGGHENASIACQCGAEACRLINR